MSAAPCMCRSMDADIATPEVEALDRLARVIDIIPGADGTGLGAADRAALFAFIESPTPQGWVDLRRLPITRHHTFWVAVMRHAEIPMFGMPTTDQVLAAATAAAAKTIST